MEVQTRDFGALTFEDKDVITFPLGIVAFDHLHRYVLVETVENSPWRTLQSVEDGNVAFAVVDPWAVAGKYDPQLSPEDLEFIGVDDIREAAFLAIAVIPDDVRKTTVNLRAPIVINPKTRMAWQVILPGDEYPIRCPVFGVEDAKVLPVQDESRAGAERRSRQVEAILVP